MPPLIIRLLTAAAVLTTLLRLCLILYFSNRGFDVYDEALYILTNKYAFGNLHPQYFYQLFTWFLFAAVTDNLTAMRVIYCIADTLAAGAFAALAVFFLRREAKLSGAESALVFVFILSASCLGLQERVISNNSLENWSALLIAGISLHLPPPDKKIFRLLMLVLIAFFFCILFLVKASSFAAVLGLWLIFLRVSERNLTAFLTAAVTVIIGSLICSLTVLYASGFSLSYFISEHKAGYAFNKIVGYGTWTWFFYCYLYHAYNFAAGMAIVLAIAGMLYFFRLSAQLKWLITAIAACLYYLFPREKEYDELIYGWANLCRYYAVFIPPTAGMAFYFYYARLMALTVRQKILIGIAAALPLAAVTVSFLSIHFNLYSILAPWALLIALAVVFLLRNGAQPAATLMAGIWLGFALFVTVRFQILEPRHLGSPLTEQNIPLPELNVLIDDNMAALLAVKEKLTDSRAEVLALCNLGGIPLAAGLKPHVSTLFVTFPLIKELEERNIRANMSLLRKYHQPGPLYVVIKKSLMPYYADSLASIGIPLLQDFHQGSYPFNFPYPTLERPEVPLLDSVYVFYLRE